ncbi:MAG: hypothetical protein OQJ98_00540 [Candidatus Pacebacteria bacterium]|nr:hypothetical protein [Candidatus Paceibacterota bacterium]
MSVLLLLLGYACLGYVAYQLTKELFAIYPYGVKKDGDKFWWSKWLPGLGFTLCLMAAGEPFYTLIPGILIMTSSYFFIPKKKVT